MITITPDARDPKEVSVYSLLVASEIYQDYERSFTEMTGLPLSLRPAESWQLPHHQRAKENSFCALMASKSTACAACLRVQQQLVESCAGAASATVTCEMGLVDSAVPVRMGEQVVAYLQTGQLFTRTPSEAGFKKAAAKLAEWGLTFDLESLRATYFASKTLKSSEYASLIRLLEIFAEHISILSNKIVIQHQSAEPTHITRAKAFIEESYREDLSLAKLAAAVQCSIFYFCKSFKKTTGMGSTEYVSRVRIEKAKNLLLNPNLRISEIGYEVGFQSLTHFNRVFKNFLGESPTEYRSKLSRTVIPLGGQLKHAA